jgi:hypothetical protein
MGTPLKEWAEKPFGSQSNQQLSYLEKRMKILRVTRILQQPLQIVIFGLVRIFINQTVLNVEPLDLSAEDGIREKHAMSTNFSEI